jgi:YHS domain-containing protein
MTFIELFAPQGALSEAKRQQFSQRLVTELMRADGAPPEMIERGRALTWLMIHEPAVWTIGGQPVAPTAAPPYLVRVTVPGGHLNDGLRAELIARLTRVLAESDNDPQRLYQEPRALVQIIELPDGNLGAFGQPLRMAEIMKLVIDPTYKGKQLRRPDEESTAATVVDPICGMTVLLTADAITWAHQGTTYGFCCRACRDLFVAQHAAT